MGKGESKVHEKQNNEGESKVHEKQNNQRQVVQSPCYHVAEEQWLAVSQATFLNQTPDVCFHSIL